MLHCLRAYQTMGFLNQTKQYALPASPQGHAVRFSALEAEGYTTCRHYDCYGAGPATRQLVAEGYALSEFGGGTATCVGRVQGDGRLHLLIVALNEEQGESAGCFRLG